jgi:peptidoglycan/LPS O-acetylase OafA/YrhL
MGGVTPLKIFASTPLNVLVNGNIAVQYFFVLSGFLTALSIFRKKDVDLLQSMAGRYMRLFPVVASATFFTFVLMKTGLMYHLDISNSVRNTEFLLNYCNFTPTLRNLLSNSIFRPYIQSSRYVGPFWTISYEFIGYFLIVILCSIMKEKKWRRIIYMFVAIFLWWQGQLNYCSFIFGTFVADLFYYTDSNTTWLSRIYTKLVRHKAFLISLYILGTYLACAPISKTGIYSFLPSMDLCRAAGIAICLWCILNCGFAQKILEIKPIQWLGKISFTTYAFHWPLMLSLEAGLFMLMINHFTYNIAALGAFLITIPCILLVSYLMWKFLENNSWINNRRKAILNKIKG